MRRTLSSYAATILLFAITLTPHGAAAGSCICFSCAFNPKLENFRASSAAMAPTMMTGDCATMRHIDPQTDQVQRGDIIGFTHPMQPATFVFRVMAIAGDRIQLKDGGVVLNGHPLPQEVLSEDISTVPTTPPFPRCAERPAIPGKSCTRFRLRETLPSGKSYEIWNIGTFRFDTTPEFIVPAEHVFVLGDHRDNAADSRVPQAATGPGMIPVENILGIFE
ncbi:Signal peptidase I [Aliiroseovarius sp. xm-m-379]|uniref:signal peptidase I n=4 Tax=Aliiroseovarius TaxID=1658781 RepID=UPI0019FE0C12|nr:MULTISPECIES: signal peptidase I [unclassified Aliiroseovarius]NRP25394.1 Signal peptidase I [Aliiroseovarius sp. xm-m-379]NRP48500.1 Signal peptidase I [Aliiroseovarius sp. xm-m-354]NRP91838.1 Signal peptidase I [Aliiroseovarius sp. xm-a-134]NRP13961.1 Signal peptidase I [Aliiroseovarius sp. xm-d-517]NRP34193.1 Signal peptidase I [Aliiroseovarius sp. xm-a-104]